MPPSHEPSYEAKIVTLDVALLKLSPWLALSASFLSLAPSTYLA